MASLLISFSADFTKNQRPSTIAISPNDEKHLAASFSDTCTIYTFPFLKPSALLTINPKHKSPIISSFFVPNSPIIVLSTSHEVFVFDFLEATLKHSQSYSEGEILSISYWHESVILFTKTQSILHSKIEPLKKFKKISLKTPFDQYISHFCGAKLVLLHSNGSFSILNSISDDLENISHHKGARGAERIFYFDSSVFLFDKLRILKFNETTGECLKVFAPFDLNHQEAIFLGCSVTGNKMIFWNSHQTTQILYESAANDVICNGNPVPVNCKELLAFNSLFTLTETHKEGIFLASNTLQKQIPALTWKKVLNDFVPGNDILWFVEKSQSDEIAIHNISSISSEVSKILLPQSLQDNQEITALDESFLEESVLVGTSRGVVYSLSLQSKSIEPLFTLWPAISIAKLEFLRKDEETNILLIIDISNTLTAVQEGVKIFRLKPGYNMLKNDWELSAINETEYLLKFEMATEVWETKTQRLVKSERSVNKIFRQVKSWNGIFLDRDGLHIDVESTDFSKIGENFVRFAIDRGLWGTASVSGKGVLLRRGNGDGGNERTRSRRDASSDERGRSKSVIPRFREKSQILHKSTFSTILSVLQDAVGTIDFEKTHQFTFTSIKVLLDCMKSPYILNQEIGLCRLQQLLRNTECDITSTPPDSKHLAFLIALAGAIDIRKVQDRFVAVIEPMIRLTIDGDPIACRIFCDASFYIWRKLKPDESARLVASLLAACRYKKQVYKPLMQIALCDTVNFIANVVLTVKSGGLHALNLFNRMIMEIPWKILQFLEEFCEALLTLITESSSAGGVSGVTTSGDSSKKQRKILMAPVTQILHELIQAFPMVAKTSQYLAVGLPNGEIVYYDLKKSVEDRKKFKAHEETISCIAFDDSGTALASFSTAEMTCKIFDLSNKAASMSSSFIGNLFSSLSSLTEKKSPSLNLKEATMTKTFPKKSAAISSVVHPHALWVPLKSVRIYWRASEVQIIREDGNFKFQASISNNKE
jgi:hypothetical protein